MRKNCSKFLARAALAAGLLVSGVSGAAASPWAEVGDEQLRHDIEVLAGHGLIDGVITTWPLPWAQVSRILAVEPGRDLPAYVRRSLDRVRNRYREHTETNQLKGTLTVRTTNEPALVRPFAARARDEIDARIAGEYMWSSTAVRLSLGLFSPYDFNDPDFSLNDSYIAQELGNVLFYAGAMDHWWGPGEISSIILSNNARPFPRIGFMRNNPKAFETPWLSWIGPWQINGFVGILEEDDRVVDNPLVAGLRLTVNPLPGLELGASRIFQICGEGRSCDLNTFGKAFIGRDNDTDAEDPSNQLAGFDGRFSSSLFGQPFSIYAQYIGEDEANQLPSKAAGLVGLSLWGGLGRDGAQWRLTGEASDTTASFFRSGKNFNDFYDHSIYQTGYRYRGRTIGHSLDNDTRLYSIVGSVTDIRDWTYKISFHHAQLNRDDAGAQPVSDTAEDINMLYLDMTIPWGRSLFELGLRFQDDVSNSPGDTEVELAAEAGWRYRF